MEHVIKAVVPAKYLDAIRSITSTPQACSPSVALKVTVVSPAARLSSTLMVGGALMVEVPSLARIPPRWIGLPRTIAGGLPSP